MNYTCISIWVSIGSLLISSIALWRYFRKDIAEVVRNRKALIRVKGYKRGTLAIVRIWNEGVAPARNIRFVSKDIENDDHIMLRFEPKIFPYPVLNHGESFEIEAKLMNGRNEVPKITMIWNDDYGKNRKIEQVLMFD